MSMIWTDRLPVANNRAYAEPELLFNNRQALGSFGQTLLVCPTRRRLESDEMRRCFIEQVAFSFESRLWMLMCGIPTRDCVQE